MITSKTDQVQLRLTNFNPITFPEPSLLLVETNSIGDYRCHAIGVESNYQTQTHEVRKVAPVLNLLLVLLTQLISRLVR